MQRVKVCHTAVPASLPAVGPFRWAGVMVMEFKRQTLERPAVSGLLAVIGSQFHQFDA